jgi:DnaK suppressor protein
MSASTSMPRVLQRYSVCMDLDRARQLLARERDRINQATARPGHEDPEAASEQNEPGDRGSEDLYQHEFDAGLAEDLTEQLAALERAEARLAAGTYGLSTDSGEPIPDARLEALPTAERTVDEQELRGRE